MIGQFLSVSALVKQVLSIIGHFVQSIYLCYNTGKFLVGGAYHGRVSPQVPHLHWYSWIIFPWSVKEEKKLKELL